MTVSQALHWYGLEHAPNTRAPWRIAYSIEALAPLLGPVPLQKVTANVRRRYVRDWPAAGRPVATARKELGTLDAAAWRCVQDGYLTHYPDDQWLPDSAPPRERWLSESDVARLLWKAR